MTIYITFETTEDGGLVRRGQYQTEDFVSAAELFIASFKLVRYNKLERGEAMGVFHMLDTDSGEIHWLVVEGPHQLAVKKMEPDDVLPIAWLIDPIVATKIKTIEEERDELEETSREQERLLDSARGKIGELMDTIEQASRQIDTARQGLDNNSLPNYDDLKTEVKSRLQSAVTEIVDDLFPSDSDIPDLESLDSELEDIERELDNADGSFE